jgi:hypothetical protein
MAYVYARDETAIREWVEASKTAEGALAYLDKYVHGVKNHTDYLALVGQERLTQMVAERERRE